MAFGDGQFKTAIWVTENCLPALTAAR